MNTATYMDCGRLLFDMLIDFTEIPSSKGGSKEPDEFELFAREFLSAIGFKVLEGPDRGPDGGRDIIALEVREGVAGCTNVRWLVSCKHFAHSNKAVGADDELNITDRLNQFSCGGFIGFYTTIPSSALSNRLKSLDVEKLIFDKELIERKLIEDGQAYSLIKRFFPKSWKQIEEDEREVSNLLYRYYPLECEFCGKDLLQFPQDGLFALVTDRENCFHVTNAYCACRGRCDEILENRYAKNSTTSWNDIDDLIIPKKYLEQIIGLADEHRDGSWTYTDTAYKKIKETYIRLAQLVMRKHSDMENARMKILDVMP